MRIASMFILIFACSFQSVICQVTFSKDIGYKSDRVNYRPLGLTAMNGKFITAINGYIASARIDSDYFAKISTVSDMTDFYYSFIVQVIDDDPKYVFMITYKGDALVIVADTDFMNYSVRERKYIRFFNDYISNYLYKYARKPGAPYFYVTSIRSSRVLKIPYNNLDDFKTINSNTGSAGYEGIAIARSGMMLMLSANGKRFEVWETNTDTYINEIEQSAYAFSTIYRSVAYYPVPQTRDMFMACRSVGVCHLISLSSSGAHSIENEYSISINNPEFLFHVNNTRCFVAVGPNTMHIINADIGGTSVQVSTGYTDKSGYDVSFTVYNGEMYMGLLSYDSHTIMKVYSMSNAACHFACKQCTASGQINTCTECQKGYTLSGTICNKLTSDSNFVDSSNSVVASCGTGFFVTDTRECKACPANCDACFDSTGFCSQCQSSYNIQTDGSCAASCKTNEYASNSRCYRCHISCKSCSGPAASQCSTCAVGSPTAGKCTPPAACASKQQYNWYKGECQSCDSQYSSACSTCTMQDLGYSCLECDSPYYEILGLCYTSCPKGSVTQSKSCKICEESPTDKFYTDDGCKSTCPSGSNMVDNIACSNMIKNPNDREDPTKDSTTNGIIENSEAQTRESITIGAIIGGIVGVVILGCIVMYFVDRHIKKRNAARVSANRGNRSESNDGRRVDDGAMIPMLQIKMDGDGKPIEKGSLQLPPGFLENTKYAPMPYVRSYPPAKESLASSPDDMLGNELDNRATIHEEEKTKLNDVRVRPKAIQPRKNDSDDL